MGARLNNLSPDRVLDPFVTELLDRVRTYASGASLEGQPPTPAQAALIEARQALADVDPDSRIAVKVAEEHLWDAEVALRAERSAGMHALFSLVDHLFDEALYEFKRVASWKEIRINHAEEGKAGKDGNPPMAELSTMQNRVTRHEEICGIRWDEPR